MADPTDSRKTEKISEEALFEARSDQPTVSEADSEPAAAETAAPRKGGRGLALFSLLLALVALGGVGYLYYLDYGREDPLAAVNTRIASIETDLAAENRRLEEAMDQLRSRQARALEDFAREQRSELEATKESLLESLQQLAGQAPPSSREWKVAEVGYLLRIANHRLLMERDVAGALELLNAADAILAELDDFTYYQVRSNLTEEIRALKAVESNDLTGIYLQLETLKQELAELPLKLPQYLEAKNRINETTESEAEGFWPTLRDELASKFRVRSFDGEIKPLLSPQEAAYLELNLRLMLERAQLAALRREQQVFTESLQTAAGWLEAYLQADDAAVRDAVAELNRMAQIPLDVDMPDISGSLSALNALRQES